MRLINADALIDKINKSCGNQRYLIAEQLWDIINSQPTVPTEEYNSGWIPCRVRLPNEPETEPVTLEDIENTTEYIVMIAGATVPTTLHYLGNGVWWQDTYYKVTAWQPLPPAYITEGVDSD